MVGHCHPDSRFIRCPSCKMRTIQLIIWTPHQQEVDNVPSQYWARQCYTQQWHQGIFEDTVEGARSVFKMYIQMKTA